VIDIPSYTIAWLVYLLSSIGLMVVFWRCTRGLTWRRTRRVMRIVVAVALLTPMNIVADGLWLAPAFLVSAYAFAQQQADLLQQSISTMGSAVIIMILVVLLESAGRRLLGMRYGV